MDTREVETIEASRLENMSPKSNLIFFFTPVSRRDGSHVLGEGFGASRCDQRYLTDGVKITGSEEPHCRVSVEENCENTSRH